ncbi:hypothetical protein D3C80_1825340 [compost metagenome]
MRLHPHGVIHGLHIGVEALRLAQLHGHRAAHQQQGVDREVRVHLQRHAIAGGEALHVEQHVASLGRNLDRRGVAGGLEDAAEQDRSVDQGGAGFGADPRQLGVGQVAGRAAEVEE